MERREHHFRNLPSEILDWPAFRPNHLTFLFIPGNPGLIDFYVTFLQHLHTSLSGRARVIGISQLGHTIRDSSNTAAPLLSDQIAHKIDFIQSLDLDSSNLVLCGHSVGAYMCLKILESIGIVRQTILLFPTISHIADTPNGYRLQPMFTVTGIRLTRMSTYVASYLPTALLCRAIASFTGQDPITLPTTAKLVSSPRLINVALRLARDEMESIKELPSSLAQFAQGIRIYWSPQNVDKWTTEDIILEITDAMAAVGQDRNWSRCKEGLPHDFCTRTSHSTYMADRCVEWLNDVW